MTDQQNAITPYQGGQIIRSYDDAERAAKAMAASGYFSDAKQFSQAVVKILAGQEMGFGAFASMTGIHIIHDRPAIGANLMAAAVKRHPLYDYRVIEMTDAAVELAFFERGQEIGRSRFTAQDANKAGTQNMGKFPRNMLFARAISNGVRWYCPDVFSGSAVYTPEELGATVNDDGDVIDVPVIDRPDPAAQPEAPKNGNGNGNGQIPEAERPDAKLLKRWGDLYAEAQSWHIEVASIDPAKITKTELIERGKALKAQIEQAEAADAAARAEMTEGEE